MDADKCEVKSTGQYIGRLLPLALLPGGGRPVRQRDIEGPASSEELKNRLAGRAADILPRGFESHNTSRWYFWSRSTVLTLAVISQFERLTWLLHRDSHILPPYPLRRA